MPALSHSRLGGSVSYRFRKCAGSVRAAAGMPNRSSEHAAAGTVAHDLAERELRGDHLPGKRCVMDYLGDRFTVDGYAIQVDQEMVEGVELYVREIRDILAQYPDAVLHVELKLDLRAIHPDMFGTSDVVIWIPSLATLYVLDFKYGYKYVEAEDNSQLQFYALGALLNLRLPVRTVRLGIIQPRNYGRKGPVRTWDVEPLHILDYAGELKEAAKATEDPDAPRTPGTHCDYCPAAPLCPELRARVFALIKLRYFPVNGQAIKYDPEQFAEAMRELPMVENWLKRMREFAFEKALHNALPGFKLVEKRPQRNWRDEETAELFLPGLGVAVSSMFDTPKLRSPAQIEKLVPKDRREDFNKLVIKQSSGLTLAPESDDAPAVRRDAASQFRSVEPTAKTTPPADRKALVTALFD
jgi:hypothetical protein